VVEASAVASIDAEPPPRRPHLNAGPGRRRPWAAACHAAPLLLAACAASPPPSGTASAEGTGGNGGACARHEAAFAALLGRPEAAVREALGRMPGIRSVRAGLPGAPMTMDYREDRATLLLRPDGTVQRITCG
jgi:hypothetical protein